ANHHSSIYCGFIYYRANHHSSIYCGFIYHRVNHHSSIYCGFIYYRANHHSSIYCGFIYYRANHSTHHNSINHNSLFRYPCPSLTLGGDMVSVTSPEEVDFLKGWSGAPSDFWVGIEYDPNTGRRNWTDGSHYSFEIFKEGIFDADPVKAENQRVFMKSQVWEIENDPNKEKRIICKSPPMNGCE
ncbi:unnamed protein product, partial [Cyprideis torosa]